MIATKNGIAIGARKGGKQFYMLSQVLFFVLESSLRLGFIFCQFSALLEQPCICLHFSLLMFLL